MSVRESATRFADASGASSPLFGTNGRSAGKSAGSNGKGARQAAALARNGTGKARTGKHGPQAVASLHTASSLISTASRGNSPIDSANSPSVHSAQKGKTAQSKSASKGKNAPGKSKASSSSKVIANSPVPVSNIQVSSEEEAAGRVRKKPIIGSKNIKKERTGQQIPQGSSSPFEQFGRTVDNRQSSPFTQSNYQVGSDFKF